MHRSYHSFRRPASAARLPVVALSQALEPRTLFAVPAPSAALFTAPTVRVVIDYSLDANNFFNTQSKRDLLRQAADSVAEWFADSLLALAPAGTDSWDAVLDHPATGLQHTIANPTVEANQVLLFAGGRDMSDALGRGGPGGYQARGSTAWRNRVANRGQSGTTSAPEFGPWGGAITFDTVPATPWYFGATTSGIGSANDFLSVAIHEVAHLFGFGTSDAWNNQANTTTNRFSGPVSVALHDGSGNVPLASDDSHWANGTIDEGQEVAMDPLITTGTRRLLTPLDFAGLDDIGWSMPPRVTSVVAPAVLSASTTPRQFNITFAHYAALDSTTVDAADVTVVAPDGATLPASFVSSSSSAGGTSRIVTYALAPPGGDWDPADSGTYSIVLTANQVRSTTGEAVAAGTLGTFVADIADAPVGALQPFAAPAPASSSHTIVVAYTDAVAVNPASIDLNDITVTGPGGAPVVVTGAAADSLTPGTPRLATYALAAPGGTWGPEDDGVYTVNLVAGAVADTSGNLSAAATTGTFTVMLGAIAFDARTPVIYTDATGDVVRVMLKGPGTGRVRFNTSRPADAVALELDATTVATTLNIRTGLAGTPVGGIVINGSLKSLVGKTLDLAGNLAATGSIGTLRLRSTTAGGTVSAAAFRSITAGAWAAGVSSGSSLNRLKVASLAGDVRAAGGIGKITAGSMTGARVFAGVGADLAADLPTLNDFSNPAASIRSVVTKSFTSSFVAAPTIGKLSLGLIAGGGGVAADRITFLSGRFSPTERPFKSRNLDAPGSGPVLSDFNIRVL